VLAISFWESIWLIIVIFFWITWLMIMFSIIMDLFRDRELGGGAKAIWFLFILFLPLLGGLVYLIVRGKGMGERSMKEQIDAKNSFDEYVRQTAGGGGSGAASELAKANDLLKSGAITQADYDALKSKILG
jgi:Phospholipase_D-nuclease N-terminal